MPWYVIYYVQTLYRELFRICAVSAYSGEAEEVQGGGEHPFQSLKKGCVHSLQVAPGERERQGGRGREKNRERNGVAGDRGLRARARARERERDRRRYVTRYTRLAHVHVSQRASRVRACVRACVCVCVRACVRSSAHKQHTLSAIIAKSLRPSILHRSLHHIILSLCVCVSTLAGLYIIRNQYATITQPYPRMFHRTWA